MVEMVVAGQDFFCAIFGVISEAFNLTHLVPLSRDTWLKRCLLPAISRARCWLRFLLPSRTSVALSPGYCSGQTRLFLLSTYLKAFARVISCQFWSVQGAEMVPWHFTEPPVSRSGFSSSSSEKILHLTLSKVTFCFCASVPPSIKWA